jgi:toxin ParE1/3/4
MTELDLSPAARVDLVDIRKYSIEQFSATVADAYFLGFDEAFSLLRRHPLAGEAKPDLGRDIRCIVHRKHRIFYRYDGDTVLIIRVIHHAQDAHRALN